MGLLNQNRAHLKNSTKIDKYSDLVVNNVTEGNLILGKKR